MMSDAGPRAFTDLRGRAWTIEITVAVKKRLRTETGFDVADLFDPEGRSLVRLATDPEYLVDVLFCALRDRLAEKQVGPEEFAASLGGQPLGDSYDALVGAVIDFFPQSRARDVLRGIIAKGEAVKLRALDSIGARVEALDPDALADEWIAKSSGSPVSLAKTSDPTPSANCT